MVDLPGAAQRLSAQSALLVYRAIHDQLTLLEEVLLQVAKPRQDYQLLTTIPGVGAILGMTIALETGDIGRFPAVGHYASYCRCVKSEKLSNGKKKGEGNGVVLPTLRAKAPHKNNEHVALFLSRIHPKKGLPELVEAWKQAKPSGWKVVVAGPDEGQHRRVVETALRNAGMDTLFEFVGPVEGETKTDLYRGADLFILPSFSENFGVVVAEALACEVPVITTKGTPWQGLETHQCGWWVDLGSDPLAAAIRQATALSDAERQAMGRRGRAYVEREFGWPGIAEQMLAVYQWVLGQGPKPGCLVTD